VIAENPSLQSLRGKYRNLMSSSKAFASRKAKEIALEEQHLGHHADQHS
jgi:hypothetical protein